MNQEWGQQILMMAFSYYSRIFKDQVGPFLLLMTPIYHQRCVTDLEMRLIVSFQLVSHHLHISLKR